MYVETPIRIITTAVFCIYLIQLWPKLSIKVEGTIIHGGLFMHGKINCGSCEN